MTTENTTETTSTETVAPAKKARKPRKKAEPKKPTWASLVGQDGPAIEVAYADLNPKEKRVVAALAAQEGRKPLTLSELADASFSKGAKAKRNSWVRNCMRRLTRGGWAEHAEEKGDGTYRLTKNGKDRLRRLSLKATSTTPKAEQVVEIPAEVVAEIQAQSEPATQE